MIILFFTSCADGSLGLLQHKMLGRSHSSPPENESNHELVSYARDGLDTTKLPTADTLTAQRLCSLRYSIKKSIQCQI